MTDSNDVHPPGCGFYVLVLLVFALCIFLGFYVTPPKREVPVEPEPVKVWRPGPPPDLTGLFDPIPVAHKPRPPPQVTYVVLARVTACSPYDSAKDRAYYRKYGYKGAKSNAVAADPRVLRTGAYVLIPGYSDKFVPVDSLGGPYIRRSTSKGVLHIDVKFPTYRAAKKWGTRWLDIQILENP